MIEDLLNQYKKIVYERIHFSKDELYFFLHMPKTAGTTFRHILYNHIDQAHILPSRKFLKGELKGKYLSGSDLLMTFDMKNIHQQFQVVCGHYGIQMQTQFSIKPKVITFIREPYQRTISHLNHIKNKNPTYSKHSLIDIWADKKELLCNFQSRRLGYIPKQDNRESFLQTFDSIYFVGLTEKFDQSLSLLNTLSGWNLSSIKKRNTSPPTKTIALAQLKNEIHENLELDYLIYNRRLKQFQN